MENIQVFILHYALITTLWYKCVQKTWNYYVHIYLPCPCVAWLAIICETGICWPAAETVTCGCPVCPNIILGSPFKILAWAWPRSWNTYIFERVIMYS